MARIVIREFFGAEERQKRFELELAQLADQKRKEDEDEDDPDGTWDEMLYQKNLAIQRRLEIHSRIPAEKRISDESEMSRIKMEKFDYVEDPDWVGSGYPIVTVEKEPVKEVRPTPEFIPIQIQIEKDSDTEEDVSSDVSEDEDNDHHRFESAKKINRFRKCS